jgi:hypothetical protein
MAWQEDKNWKYFSIQCSRISKRELLFGRFSGSDPLSFWYNQREDEDECGAMVV